MTHPSLEELTLRAVEGGLQELTVRAARIEGDTVVAWQCVGKFAGQMRGPWQVAVRASAEAAMRTVLTRGRPALRVVKNEEDGGIFG